MSTALATDVELADEVAKFYSDPAGFVRFAYPWGEKGTPLENYAGPDKWQQEFLVALGEEVKANSFDGRTPVPPIRRAVSSGHGPGKSTTAAWLVDWIMSTRPYCRGTVTANKWDQLETKTWAAVQKWTRMCITGHWFEISGTKMYQRDNRDTWFCSPANSKEENSESFAGQHAADSTSFYIFDEDSGVPDVIHEVAEGGLTDGEPMIFVFGNATRSTGHFYRVCFGTQRARWKTMCLDARESLFTNKALIQEWIDDYGEDSDFVRVRVRGLPPRASELQWIDQDRVCTAQKRAAFSMPDDSLIAGVDVSDGGAAWNVVRFRCGADAVSIPPIRIPGEAVRNDRSALLAKLADVLNTEYEGRRVAAMFVDSAFGAPYVERLHAMGHDNVIEVRFGSTSPDTHYANLRAYMWGRLKDWLAHGSIDQKDTKLETDLTAPGYHLNPKDQIVIESKESMQKRGQASPDDGDALALTFAAPVGVPGDRRHGSLPPMPTQWSWG